MNQSNIAEPPQSSCWIALSFSHCLLCHMFYGKGNGLLKFKEIFYGTSCMRCKSFIQIPLTGLTGRPLQLGRWICSIRWSIILTLYESQVSSNIYSKLQRIVLLTKHSWRLYIDWRCSSVALHWSPDFWTLIVFFMQPCKNDLLSCVTRSPQLDTVVHTSL